MQCTACQWRATASVFMSLVFDAKSELLDHRICENFTRNSFDLVACDGGFDVVLKGEEKVLTLTDIVDTAVFHAAEGIGYGLALCIEDGSFERDIDMGLHDV